MKFFPFAIGVYLFAIYAACAEEIITNSRGEAVRLKDDFTWEFVDSPGSGGDVGVVLPEKFISLSMKGTRQIFPDECSFIFDVTAVGVKIIKIGISGYFSLRDEDGDYMPNRGLGDRFLLIDKPIKDGGVVTDITMGGGIPCEEVSEVFFEPQPDEDSGVYCTLTDGEKDDCSDLIAPMIGKSWKISNGKVVSFQGSLSKSDLRKLQGILNDKGFDVGVADGVFGKGSMKALSDFEKSIGILPSGEITKETLVAIGFYD